MSSGPKMVEKWLQKPALDFFPQYICFCTTEFGALYVVYNVHAVATGYCSDSTFLKCSTYSISLILFT